VDLTGISRPVISFHFPTIHKLTPCYQIHVLIADITNVDLSMGIIPSRLLRIASPRSLLISVLLFLAFLTLSSRLTPSSSSKYSSFLPSNYPPARLLPIDIQQHLTNITTQLEQVCLTEVAPSPVHVDPTLTLAQERRYAHLRDGNGRYMLVTTTKDIASQLPDLLNTILILVSFLGSAKISVSIHEGPSSDCTPQVLETILGPLLLSLGVPAEHVHITVNSSKIDFSRMNRIVALAELRNQAISPLWSGEDDIQAIVFFNDVFLKAEDILEVLHQHVRSGAGITTALDWWKKRPEYFYDIWVARTVSPLLEL
jgi:alpha-1,3-mannosyltransferase